MHSRYSDELTSVGFEHEKVVTEGGQANYQIEIIEAGTEGFKATATALVDFDGDGKFNTWEIDQDNDLIEKIPD